MKKGLAIFVALVFLIGTASAAFNENMNFNDDADASVDRPLMNHVKAFFNEYIPPVYDFIVWFEDLIPI